MSRLLRTTLFVITVGLVAAACRNPAGVNREPGTFALVQTPSSHSMVVDGSVYLSGGDSIQWRRVFPAAGGGHHLHVVSGVYTWRGDSLRVNWTGDFWYTLGARRADTLHFRYSGPADEGQVEFYVRQVGQ